LKIPPTALSLLVVAFFEWQKRTVHTRVTTSIT